MSTGRNRIGSRRRAVQVLLTLILVAAVIPGFFGLPLFGLEMGTGSFRFLGLPVKATGLFPVLLLLLGLLALFLWAAVTLGRFWCGWLCPQSLVSDLATAAGKKFKSSQRLAVHTASALAAMVFSALVLFFLVTPGSLMGGVPAGRAATAAAVWFVISLMIYLDAVYVGRTFCKLLCPYGKLLTALTGSQPVLPERVPERIADCLECAHCKKVCPMGLDPRNGKHADCIACGRCVDVCDRIMDKRGRGAGLVRYSLPENGIARGLVLKPARIILLIAGAALVFLSLYLLAAPETARLMARLTPGAKTRLTSEGKTAIFLTLSLKAPMGTYAISASGPDGPVEIRSGSEALAVDRTGKLDTGIVVLVPSLPPSGFLVTLTLYDQSGVKAAQTSLDAGEAPKGVSP